MADNHPDSSLFPGQVERLTFTLDHVRALASPVRALVFWCFSTTEPMSVTDIAAEIGKSAQTVRYHVNALLELELIIMVDERRRRSRTEHLYVRKAKTSLDSGAEGTAEYNRYRARGLALEARKITREADLFFRVLEQDPTVIPYSINRKIHVKVSQAQADKLRHGISRLFLEVSQNQVSRDEEGVQVNMFLIAMPTVYQSRLWAEKLGINLSDTSVEDALDLNDDTE